MTAITEEDIRRDFRLVQCLKEDACNPSGVGVNGIRKLFALALLIGGAEAVQLVNDKAFLPIIYTFVLETAKKEQLPISEPLYKALYEWEKMCVKTNMQPNVVATPPPEISDEQVYEITGRWPCCRREMAPAPAKKVTFIPQPTLLPVAAPVHEKWDDEEWEMADLDGVENERERVQTYFQMSKHLGRVPATGARYYYEYVPADGGCFYHSIALALHAGNMRARDADEHEWGVLPRAIGELLAKFQSECAAATDGLAIQYDGENYKTLTPLLRYIVASRLTQDHLDMYNIMAIDDPHNYAVEYANLEEYRNAVMRGYVFADTSTIHLLFEAFEGLLGIYIFTRDEGSRVGHLSSVADWHGRQVNVMLRLYRQHYFPLLAGSVALRTAKAMRTILGDGRTIEDDE